MGLEASENLWQKIPKSEFLPEFLTANYADFADSSACRGSLLAKAFGAASFPIFLAEGGSGRSLPAAAGRAMLEPKAPMALILFPCFCSHGALSPCLIHGPQFQIQPRITEIKEILRSRSLLVAAGYLL